jgi:signal transduction histidine kinase
MGPYVEQQCDEQLRGDGNRRGTAAGTGEPASPTAWMRLARTAGLFCVPRPPLIPNNGRRRVRITVADCGHGMGAATMKQIFDPFFTTKGTVGTGLGLWVCKQLIDKNGGSIRVRSNMDGQREERRFPSCSLPRRPANPLTPPSVREAKRETYPTDSLVSSANNRK